MCVVNNIMKEEINWSVSWQVQVQQMGGVTEFLTQIHSLFKKIC